MRLILIAGLLLICGNCWAGDWALHLNLGSYHFKSEVDGVPLSDETPGIGARYRGEHGWLTGGYIPENSFGNETWYGGGGFEMYSRRYFGAGFQGVIASGYEDTPARNGGFVGSLVLRFGSEKNALNLHWIGFKSAVGLQYQMGFGG